MGNYRVEAIANEFLSLRGDSTWPQQMYIQKLCHIANGWNLAINDEPLIDEAPEAWDNGPVFRSLWDAIKDYGYRGEHCKLTYPTTGEPIQVGLKKEEKEVIKLVWQKYHKFTARELSDLTHEEGSPWEKTYFQKGRNRSLDLEDVKNHYTALALAGRV